MAPLPSLAPSLWGSASPFTAALNSMKGVSEQQQQQASDVPSQIQSAVFAAMNGGSKSSKVVAAAPAEPGAIKMYSPEYYMTCALGGVVSCGATHTAVTPLVSLRAAQQQRKAVGPGIAQMLQHLQACCRHAAS